MSYYVIGLEFTSKHILPPTYSIRMTAVSRYSFPGLQDLAADIHERNLAVQKKSGCVPNMFLACARRPEEFRAFFAHHDALMEKDGGLSKAERAMIVVAISAANQCQYYVLAQGADQGP
jgi:uncharacterized peroxidase-related enzyme